MASEGKLSRIDTALDAASDPLADSKTTAPTAGTAETNWRLTPPGDSLANTAAYPSNQPPLEQLGRYRLEKVLGRGGMGLVWLAHDPQLHRSVAIKTVRPDLRLGDDALAMFLDEGRRLASLNHASIIPVYDCGNEKGICYLVSEYVPQGSLADYLKRESLTYRQAAELVARIAEAAHYAHLRGLVHRDIKPANILMREDGKPLLADFGLAIAEEEQLREAPGTLGTYAYMAPEQMRGESRFVDGRADIYSLGVILYQLLTGRMPYLANSRDEYRELSLHRDPRPPRSVREDIPPELEAICLKCLARQPSERYSTAADLATALHTFLAKGAPQKTRDTSRQAVWAAALALVVVAATGLSLAVWRPWATASGPSDPGKVAIEPGVPTALRGEIEKQLWRQRLGHDPKEIFWPGYRGQSLISFEDDPRVLSVTSSFPRLVQLGEITTANHILAVSMKQPTWTDGCGLFFGYREEDREGRKYATFQGVIVAPLTDAAGARRLHLLRRMYRISPTTGTLGSYKQLGDEVVDWPVSESPIRLELHLSPAGLTRARWANRELSANTCAVANPQVNSTDYIGPWGLFHGQGSSWFQDPKVVSLAE